MSAKRRKDQDDRLFSLVGKGGRITFPANFLDLKLGQRVYFDVGERGVVMLMRPKRSHRGRLLSARVRRGIRSLARYGPRASKDGRH
jgi:bifunctional DNA-binding transcriptional regulator/antitoxin component of YhaV-PrlF toxin-antitoxin module